MRSLEEGHDIVARHVIIEVTVVKVGGCTRYDSVFDTYVPLVSVDLHLVEVHKLPARETDAVVLVVCQLLQHCDVPFKGRRIDDDQLSLLHMKVLLFLMELFDSIIPLASCIDLYLHRHVLVEEPL